MKFTRLPTINDVFTRIYFIITAIFLIIMLSAPFVFGQELGKPRHIGTNRDWQVFIAEDPLECWAFSLPRQQINTRDGLPIQVVRSESRMTVLFRPDMNVYGEVSYTGGYPYELNHEAKVTIDRKTFTLFTSGEWAFTFADDQDTAMVEAMKAGSTAIVTGRSERGTDTRDSISLLGFTAAFERIEQLCPRS